MADTDQAGRSAADQHRSHATAAFHGPAGQRLQERDGHAGCCTSTAVYCTSLLSRALNRKPSEEYVALVAPAGLAHQSRAYLTSRHSPARQSVWLSGLYTATMGRAGLVFQREVSTSIKFEIQIDLKLKSFELI